MAEKKPAPAHAKKAPAVQKRNDLEIMMGKPSPEDAMKREAELRSIGDIEIGLDGQKKEKIKRKAESANVVRSGLKVLERSFPNLGKDLKRAEMGTDAVSFISRALLLSLVITLVLTAAAFALAVSFNLSQFLVVAIMPVIYLAIFSWIMQYPRIKIGSKERNVDRDVLYAGRDMLIALKSGVPLFNAMANVTKNYGAASTEFTKIVEKIESGVPAELALQESSDLNTSKPFRQILLQIITSLRSGSDIALALEVVLNQISREQVIALKRYGQKLNPITMFYMLFGIILPSLGIAIGIILTSFVSLKIDFGILLIVLAILTMMQYLFLAIIMSSRPQFEV